MRESTTRYLLGAYHAIAGVAGVATVVWAIPSFWRRMSLSARLPVVAMFCVMVTAFLVVLAAGVLLLRRRPGAIRFAAIIQVLQLPVFTAGVWQRTFFAGAYAAILASNARNPLSIDLGAKSALMLSWAGAPSGTVSVGINVVPLGVLWLLRRLQDAAASDAIAGSPATSGASAA